MKPVLAAAMAFALIGCTMAPTAPLRATAELQPTKGNKAFGEATFEQVGDKVHAVIYLQGLTPGREHGLHLHQVGDCSAPDAASAKEHFNPQAKQHGHFGSPERHAGDLPAVKADQAGRGKIDVQVDIISVRPGPASVIGRSVIVHADPDDYTSQPAGNSGARIACGVVREG